MEDGGGGGRSRRFEFSDETSASSAGLTLGGILSIKQTPPYRIQDRTLLDLIRDDQTYGRESKNTWKMLREKLRLRLLRSAGTTDGNRTMTRNSTDTTRLISVISPPVNNASIVADTQTENVETEVPVEEHERTLPEEDRGGGGDGGEPTAVRMSLMSLLQVEGSAYLAYEDNDDDEEKEDAAAVEESGGGGDGGGGEYKYNYCCVCMVRHKGAAFIPCGHTFCRLCSRELFVKRASCPLCNNFILEILDIF